MRQNVISLLSVVCLTILDYMKKKNYIPEFFFWPKEEWRFLGLSLMLSSSSKGKYYDRSTRILLFKDGINVIRQRQHFI